MSSELYSSVDIELHKQSRDLLRILRSEPTEVLKNIFGYELSPSDDLSKMKLSDYYADLSHESEPETSLPDINTVYCIISYPVKNKALVKFKTSDVTYGKLLYLNTIAYQLMYKTEDEDVGGPTGNIKGMFNRAPSKGRFGIYGHHIEDLVYNGGSRVTIFGKVAVCEFSVDS